jgi:hypothetical protein
MARACSETTVGGQMTTLTMRYINGHFVVVGPDISLMRFKSRAEARDWCKAHHPGSPITEIGRDASSRVVAKAKSRPKEPKGSAGVS